MRSGLKTGLAAALALSVAGLAVVPASEAHEASPSKWKRSTDSTYQGRYVKRRPSRHVETADDVDANAYDPACNYCGYPSWARKALAPKDGGSGGRN